MINIFCITKKRTFVTLMALLLSTSSLYANIQQANVGSVTIFAEQSMYPGISDLSSTYSRLNNVIVSVNFGLPTDVLSQSGYSKVADVFISSHENWVDGLKRLGIADLYNITTIARDKLVLVTNKNNPNIPAEISEDRSISIKDAVYYLNQNNIRVIIDNKQTSLGLYSKEILNGDSSLGYIERIIEDTSKITDLLKSNSDNFIICFGSQIKDTNSTIILAQSSDIVVHKLVVMASENMTKAREFAKFLTTNTAKSVLKGDGFVIDK